MPDSSFFILFTTGLKKKNPKILKIVRTDPEYRREIDHCIQALQKGQVILYPSDSLWGIGCDATNVEAIEKIVKLKQRSTSKSLITLVSSWRMLQNVVRDIPEIAEDILENTTVPLTIVFPSATEPYKHLAATDGTIGVRMVNVGFANDLIERYRKPLISTSANLSGEKTPVNRQEIERNLIDMMDYCVMDLGFELSGKPSGIISLKMNGGVKIIRH